MLSSLTIIPAEPPLRPAAGRVEDLSPYPGLGSPRRADTTMGQEQVGGRGEGESMGKGERVRMVVVHLREGLEDTEINNQKLVKRTEKLLIKAKDYTERRHEAKQERQKMK